MMRIATATLKSIAPYGQSRQIVTPREDRETYEAYEERVWKERAHINRDGFAFIPPMAFKKSIEEAAKFTPRKGPTGGKSTWTKNFEAGIIVVDQVGLGVSEDDISGTWLYVPSDGRPGGSKRVWKCFPTFHAWEGSIQYLVADDSISEEIFSLYLKESGIFIGIGFFRPRNRGFWGRFDVVNLTWEST